MKPGAYLTHNAPGRCRVKIPGKRRDTGFFQDLHEDLIHIEGVKQVTVNPLSAGVLILYRQQDLSLQELKDRLGTINRFELTPGPKPVAVWEDASKRLQSFDGFLKEGSEGYIDFRSLLFIIFVLLAVRQLQQGSVLGSASNLLWYAVQLIMGKK